MHKRVKEMLGFVCRSLETRVDVSVDFRFWTRFKEGLNLNIGRYSVLFMSKHIAMFVQFDIRLVRLSRRCWRIFQTIPYFTILSYTIQYVQIEFSSSDGFFHLSQVWRNLILSHNPKPTPRRGECKFGIVVVLVLRWVES